MSNNVMNFFERNSAIFKVAAIAILALMLLIPAAMVNSLVSERKMRQNEAMEEIMAKWGTGQQITGPILTVPYSTYELNKENEKINLTKKQVFLLPEKLDFKGEITPEIRYRGLFKVPVYHSAIKIIGSFRQPVIDLHEPNMEIDWQSAFLTLGITDMRGIKELIDFNWNDGQLECEPGVAIDKLVTSGITVKNLFPEGTPSGDYIFTINLALDGSNWLNIVPVGKETTAEINSSWKNPSFKGSFLPVSREINDNGFTADWKVLELNRNYPQQWTDRQVDLTTSAFGVELLLPGDNYQLTERSTKYAILFIALTFMSFFFIEIMHKTRVHPIQYILVGFGLSLFYLLLLSLSEHIGFKPAYLVASIGIIGLITGYTSSIFKNRKLILILASILVLLYGFLFVLLQLQDLTLLIGSIGLFVILALVMYLSRKIDWYNVSGKSDEME